MDQPALEVRQDAQIDEGLIASLGMPPHPRQCLGRGNVPPVQRLVHAQAAFIGMQHLDRLQVFGNGINDGLEFERRVFARSDHGGLPHRQAEQLAHHRRRALHRQHVLLIQVDHAGQCTGAILHAGRHVGRESPPMQRPAAALHLQRLVLCDLHFQHRQVKHLAHFTHAGLSQHQLAVAALASLGR